MDLVNYLAVGNLNPSPLGYVGGSDVFPTVNAAVAQGIASAVNAFPAARAACWRSCMHSTAPPPAWVKSRDVVYDVVV
jgi:hypothetical protein